MRPVCSRLFPALLLVALGCGERPPEDDLPHLQVEQGCQPLLPGFDCLVPYPSDFFRVEDATMPSGFRIATEGPARVKGKDGINADVNGEMATDGFSRIPFIMAAFPFEISPDGFVKLFDDLQVSATTKSNSVIIDAETGALVPHFVDLDPRAADPKRRAIVLHPLVQLRERARYVVALHGVKQVDGSAVPTPEGFRRLRDGVGRSDPALAPLRPAYEERILPALDAAGLQREQVQLAWEFTTGSDEQVERDMLRVRELTLEWLASNIPEVKVTSVEENPASDIWRKIRGTVSMPLFIESVLPGSPLHRDASGRVAQNGTATFPFVAQIPVAVRDGTGPGRPLAYGHGFFGTIGEADSESARRIANRMNAVLFATEWWGMYQGDVALLADALSNGPHRTFASFERVHQAMANWMVLTRAMETVFPALPQFERSTGEALLAGEAEAFIGISQGHILGGIMAALNPDVSRPILNVGGAGFTHMMFRAKPFDGYLFMLNLALPDPFEQQKWAATTQRHFDRFDPGTFAKYLVQQPLEGSPADRRVLMQVGLGDAQVPNLGTYLHARIAGVPQLDDGASAVFGLEQVSSPHEGSALATYDFGTDVRALNEQAIPPADETPAHEGLRRLDAALTQMRTFFDEGRIVNACDGRCDPE